MGSLCSHGGPLNKDPKQVLGGIVGWRPPPLQRESATEKVRKILKT